MVVFNVFVFFFLSELSVKFSWAGSRTFNHPFSRLVVLSGFSPLNTYSESLTRKLISVLVSYSVFCFFAQWDYRCGFISTGLCLSIKETAVKMKVCFSLKLLPLHEVWAKIQRLSVFLRDQHSGRTTWFCPKREAAPEQTDNSSVIETAGEEKIKGVWIFIVLLKRFLEEHNKSTSRGRSETWQTHLTPGCSLFSPCDLKNVGNKAELCC